MSNDMAPSRAGSLPHWFCGVWGISGLIGNAVLAQSMGDRGVGGLQAAGQLAGRGVADVEFFQQGFFELFHRLFEAVDVAVALTRHGGAGDIDCLLYTSDAADE